ncbi:MAG: HAD family hydrolase [Solirubrobacteraceae bacterium]
MPPAAILDIDGTLVDTNYQHALAWWQAMQQHEVDVPVWRLHRAIGMGGDQLIASVAGDEVEEQKGDDIRAAEKPLFMAQIAEVRLLPGADDLIRVLKERGHAVVLSSSAKRDEVDHYLGMLESSEQVDDHTMSDDVEATKPEPDVVEAAMEKAGTRDAVMIGDSVFDCEAAKRAGIPSIGLLTGGFGRAELLEAGASAVFDSIAELIENISKTPLSA